VALVSDDKAYKRTWHTVADYYQQQYGVLWDPSGKDICCLCFVSWDSALYINPDAQLFSVPPVQEAAPRPYTPFLPTMPYLWRPPRLLRSAGPRHGRQDD
jgi:hypothetical protein